MKQRLLLPLFLGALIAAVGWAAWVRACDEKSKSAAAAANVSKTHACSAEAAAHCTAAQAAACKAKDASFAATHSCGGSTAVTADNAVRCPGMTGVAFGGCSHNKGANATAGACPHGANMTTADFAACPHAKGAASGACAHDSKASYPPGVSASAACRSHGTMAMHDGYCDACSDMVDCENTLRSAGTLTQVVKIKNGVMYVYTADEPRKVRQVQSAMARRNERLTAIIASGEKAKLCPDCRYMRGAIASGKLTREMVTIEGGVLTLMTSNDPSVVAKLHEIAGSQLSARAKS
jgi:hypothetical protein